jgi:hypothetical protein
MAVLIYVTGVWCLWQYAARGAMRPGDPQTDAAGCPWLQPRDVAEINSAVRFGGRASMYDRRICEKVAARYCDKLWVERVVAVRRKFPHSIVVDLAIRKPFAYVRSGGRYYLVDHGGCRLPVRARTRPEGEYPSVEGIRTAAPRVGEHWTGRPLNDCLMLAAVLREVLAGRGPGMRLASVKVIDERGSVDGLPQLVARTESGLIIDWGSYSRTSTTFYPSAAEKREELERVLDEIGDPASVEAIMVRYKREGSVKPQQGWDARGGRGSAPGRGAGVAGAGR